MKETVLQITKSDKKNKKYKALIQNKTTKRSRVLHFGGLGYQQYKDSTKIGIYKGSDHGDKKRRMNYFTRHSKGNKTKRKAVEYEKVRSSGYYTPKLLSHIYLW